MKIQLTADERRGLERLIRRGKTEVRKHRRGQIVLAQRGGEGCSVRSIAGKLGTDRGLVRKWLKRFQKVQVKGWDDRPRSGRPRKIQCLERTQVVAAAACRAPSEFGLERTLWSQAALSQALMEAQLVESISARTVGRILSQAEIKPHRVKMWCHSEDPQFQEKLRDIVGLYVDPPRGEPVLCVDEKSGMQALSRAGGLRRPRGSGWMRLEYEYTRHGTRCLFACFNIRTGRVLGRCEIHRTRADFLSFLDLVAAQYRQPRVHVVLDNLNTHRDTGAGAFISEWNRKHGNRFVFHYTPTHGSWLNQTELWFSILSRRVLRHASFACAQDLVHTVDAFIRQQRADRHRWMNSLKAPSERMWRARCTSVPAANQP